MRDAVIAELDRVYDVERELLLSRTRLIHREPALLAAASHKARQTQAALVELLEQRRAGFGPFGRQVLAAVAVGVLTAAIQAWQRHEGRVALARYVQEGFEVLKGVRWTT